jgi:hypothetical protein
MPRAALRGLAGLCVVAVAFGAGAGAMQACASLGGAAYAVGDDGGQQDSGSQDTGLGHDAQDAGQATNVTFVYTAQGFASVRLCWAPGGAWSGNPKAFPPSNTPMPASNYAGIPRGGAALVADADPLTLAAAETFDLYVLDAATVEEKETQKNLGPQLCDALACDGPALPCVGKGNYTKVTSVPALNPGFPYLLAITGPPNQLAVQTMQLGTANTFAGVLQVQAAQLSGTPGPATVSFLPAAAAGDGGADAGFQTTLQMPSDVEPAAPVPVAYAQDEASFASQGFSVDALGIDGGAIHLSMSLAQSLSLVAPTQDPSQYFQQRTPFVVAVVGDPSAAPWPGSDAGAYDGTGLHLLVLPTTAP